MSPGSSGQLVRGINWQCVGDMQKRGSLSLVFEIVCVDCMEFSTRAVAFPTFADTSVWKVQVGGLRLWF